MTVTIAGILHASNNIAPPVAEGRRIGIEVEVENIPPQSVSDVEGSASRWDSVPDDSLRNNGREFVSPPILIADVAPMLTELYSLWKRDGWEENSRTGVHVHVDARDFTPGQIMAAPTAYILTELGFFDQVGPAREENLYCVPWYRADSDVTHLARGFKNLCDKERTLGRTLFSNVMKNLRPRLCKYSAFYMEPLLRFGTIEFRHAPTFCSQKAMDDWVRVCYHFMEQVKQFNSPGEVLDAFHAVTPRQFAENMLGPTTHFKAHYNDRFDAKDCVVLAEELAVASGELEDEKQWVMCTTDLPEHFVREFRKPKHKSNRARLCDLLQPTSGLSQMHADFIATHTTSTEALAIPTYVGMDDDIDDMYMEEDELDTEF